MKIRLDIDAWDNWDSYLEDYDEASKITQLSTLDEVKAIIEQSILDWVSGGFDFDLDMLVVDKHVDVVITESELQEFKDKYCPPPDATEIWAQAVRDSRTKKETND